MDKSETHAVILTAIPPEYDAVKKHLIAVKELPPHKGTVYERGEFRCRNGRICTVAIIEIGAGNPNAALETERALEFFNPRVLFFVGVAGGLKDLRQGDVVAVTKVYGYESGKDEGSFRPRPNVGESSYSMIQRARTEARKPDWLERCPGYDQTDPPRVLVAPIAAGEKVVSSRRSDTRKYIRSNYGDAVAVDMEDRGFLQAAHANQGVAALIVRGVSDLLDNKEEADTLGFQARAAQAASAFAFEVLANLDVLPVHEIGEYALVMNLRYFDLDHPRAMKLVAKICDLASDVDLTLKRIERGSVRLVVEGTLAGFRAIEELFSLGGLTAEIGCEVLSVTWLGTRETVPPTAASEPHHEVDVHMRVQGTSVLQSKHKTKRLYTSLDHAEEFPIYAVRGDPQLECISETESATIHLVPFESRQDVAESKNHRFNNSFPLRFYVPKQSDSRSLPSRKLFVFINGYGEGTADMWDAMADALAAQRVASVLLPMPEHFCRNMLFNINKYHDDPYVLSPESGVTLRQYSAIMKYEALNHPKMFVLCNSQLMADLSGLVSLLRDPAGGSDSQRTFLQQHLSPDVHVSLMGYSLGGLGALEGYIAGPDRYRCCVLINAGPSFQDMHGEPLFQEHWRQLQRDVVLAARKNTTHVEPEAFQQVFLGNDKLLLHERLVANSNKILVLIGGRDSIINRKNIENLQPEETGLAVFQIPGLEHFINLKGFAHTEWLRWSAFAIPMILAFEQNRPDQPLIPRAEANSIM